MFTQPIMPTGFIFSRTQTIRASGVNTCTHAVLDRNCVATKHTSVNTMEITQGFVLPPIMAIMASAITSLAPVLVSAVARGRIPANRNSIPQFSEAKASRSDRIPSRTISRAPPEAIRKV